MLYQMMINITTVGRRWQSLMSSSRMLTNTRVRLQTWQGRTPLPRNLLSKVRRINSNRTLNVESVEMKK